MPDQSKKSEALSFLKTQRVAVLGTIDEAGYAHMTPMYFGVDDDFNFYFITHSKTKKMLNIERTKSASILIFNQEQFKVVQGKGLTLEVNDIDKFKAILKILPKLDFHAFKFEWPPPINKFTEGEIIAVHLQPQELYYGDFASSTSGVDGNFFAKIV